MKTAYILIWILLGYNKATSGSAYFDDLQACENARIEIKKDVYFQFETLKCFPASSEKK